MDDLDRGEPHALDARHLGGLEHQLAESDPALGIAVVADADARHDHLRLILCDALRDLLEHG